MTTSRRPPNKSATREDILAAATSLFAERDDAQITMDAICEQGTFSKKTLYEYFPSKDAIVRAVSRTVTQPDMAIVEACLAQGRSPIAVLIDLFRTQAVHVEATPRLAQTVYAYGIHDVCQPSGDEGPPPFLVVLELLFRRGQETKVFRPLPGHRLLASLAYCIFATTVLHWAAQPTGTPLPARIEAALMACLDGWFDHGWSESAEGPSSAPQAGEHLPVPGS